MGIISMDSLQKEIEMKQKQNIIEQHKYAITQLPNGQYQTYVIDPVTGKRKEIRAISKERVENKLFALHKEYEAAQHHEKQITLNALYETWLEYKTRVTSSSNTITRHKQHYRKYLKDTEFFKTAVTDVQITELEAFCNELVKSYNMTAKEWTNVKTIIAGMFKFAYKNKLIPSNPMIDVDITVRYRQVTKKSGKTQTYNTEELAALNEYLDTKYAETADPAFLACRLNFYLGLRVGELVALKWSDIEDYHLHIQREETKDREANTYEVVGHTKTYSDRYVPLVPQALVLINKLKNKLCVIKPDDFIFKRDGERITSRQIAYVLEKYAQRTGNPVKSTHKMRKTFASRAIIGRNGEQGISIDAVREILGHSNLKTTLGYIYNAETEKETYNRLANIL